MTTNWVAICLPIVVGLAPAWAGSDDATGSLEQDTQRLQGKWFMKAPGREWTINFDPGGTVQIAISWAERGGAWAGTGWNWEVKQDVEGRFIELELSTAQATELPRRLDYAFDGDALILNVNEGPLIGQHMFVRYQGRSQSYTPWIIGGGLLAVVLVAAIVALLRNRVQNVAERGASPSRDGE